jgi:hypothetical protein
MIDRLVCKNSRAADRTAGIDCTAASYADLFFALAEVR